MMMMMMTPSYLKVIPAAACHLTFLQSLMLTNILYLKLNFRP